MGDEGGDGAMRTWYVISEAIEDGGTVERHRILAPPDAAVDVDETPPQQAEAAEWARHYSDSTGKATAIDLVVEDDAGNVTNTQSGWFYYDPAFPDHNPYQDYYGY